MYDNDEIDLENLLRELDGEGKLFPEYRLIERSDRLICLGKGSFSHVYEMVSVNDESQKYAIKVINPSGIEDKDAFRESLLIQRGLAERCKNVVDYVEARIETVSEEEPKQIWLILMEKYDSLLQKDGFGKAELTVDKLKTEEGVIDFAVQIAEALKLSHDSAIMHRDIKLENVFWDSQRECYKIGDFGTAKSILYDTADTICYTDGYGAPEIVNRNAAGYDDRVDIYSFGIMLYLLLNDLKFPGSDGYTVNQIQYDPDFTFPAPIHASERIAKIINKMCAYDSYKRYYSIDEIVADLLNKEKPEISNSNEEDDVETETFVHKKEKRRILWPLVHTGREEEKKAKRNKEIRKKTIGLLLSAIGIFALLLVLIRKQPDYSYVKEWYFWVLPIMLLIESVLQHYRKVEYTFELLYISVWLYSALKLGVTMPHIIMILPIILRRKFFTFTIGVAMLGWIVMMP